MATKKTTTKKKPDKPVKIDRAMNPTFKLVWKDDKGIERSLEIGRMLWGSISPADALNLEKIIGEAIRDYFNSFIKKDKVTKQKVKKNAK